MQVSVEKEIIILLHGMGRTRASMLILRQRLKNAGYRVLNFPYNPARKSLDEISEEFIAFIKSRVAPARYHLIGHSLGNVIIRNAFKLGYPDGLGRIVMLAPPNHPSHLAKKLKTNPVYTWITGDSGQKVSAAAFYRQLPIPTVEFGVIAGDRGPRLNFSEPNDSVVRVQATKLAGMSDFIVVHHLHSFIMNSQDTADYCLLFLRTGHF